MYFEITIYIQSDPRTRISFAEGPRFREISSTVQNIEEMFQMNIFRSILKELSRFDKKIMR